MSASALPSYRNLFGESCYCQTLQSWADTTARAQWIQYEQKLRAIKGSVPDKTTQEATYLLLEDIDRVADQFGDRAGICAGMPYLDYYYDGDLTLDSDGELDPAEEQDLLKTGRNLDREDAVLSLNMARFDLDRFVKITGLSEKDGEEFNHLIRKAAFTVAYYEEMLKTKFGDVHLDPDHSERLSDNGELFERLNSESGSTDAQTSWKTLQPELWRLIHTERLLLIL